MKDIFSIRFKFIASLLLLSSLCLLSYIFLVKLTFEKEKEASIFESTSQSNKIFTNSLNQRMREIAIFAKNLPMTFENGRQNKFGEELMKSNQSILFFAIIQDGKIKFSKISDSKFQEADIAELFLKATSTLSKIGEKGDLMARFKLEGNDRADLKSELVVGFSMGQTFENLDFDSRLGGSILVLPGENYVGRFVLESKNQLKLLLSGLQVDKSKVEFAFIQKMENEEFLSSYHFTEFNDAFVFTTVPKSHAYHGLYLLYAKSAKFFLLVVFAVLSFAVVMSTGLLKNLSQLAAASEDVSQGNFDLQLNIKSKDEIESLADSFLHMAKKIKILLIETKEKARMESELNTARTVQQTLFPKQGFRNVKLQVEGVYRTASECGGDWWYHFEHQSGIFVLIADATGHGAGPAIVTAAAKTTVGIMQFDPDLTIEKLVERMNFSIFETSNGEIMMTACVFQFANDGSVRYINASHEAPLFYSDSTAKFLELEKSTRLGESRDQIFLSNVLEQSGPYAITLYTDGITGQTNDRQKDFGERRLLKLYQSKYSIDLKLNEMNDYVVDDLDKFRGTEPQYDDVTIVSVRVA